MDDVKADGCSSTRVEAAPFVPEARKIADTCYNVRADATTSYKYHCDANNTVVLEKWVDHDRCGGPLGGESEPAPVPSMRAEGSVRNVTRFSVPSGACLPGTQRPSA